MVLRLLIELNPRLPLSTLQGKEDWSGPTSYLVTPNLCKVELGCDNISWAMISWAPPSLLQFFSSDILLQYNWSECSTYHWALKKLYPPEQFLATSPPCTSVKVWLWCENGNKFSFLNSCIIAISKNYHPPLTSLKIILTSINLLSKPQLGAAPNKSDLFTKKINYSSPMLRFIPVISELVS